MANTKIKISELKKVISKVALGIDKSNINPDAGYIEIATVTNTLAKLKVASKDYYLESFVAIDGEDDFDVTINSDTFIGVISKADVEDAELRVENNALIMATGNAEYTFPMVTENGINKSLSEIAFDDENAVSAEMKADDIVSVATSNLQGLVDATFAREVQQFIYVDNIGALTFTDYVYNNDFKSPSDTSFRFLLNAVQTNLLKIFNTSSSVFVFVQNSNENDNVIVKFVSTNPNVKLVCTTQTPSMINMFPALKIRNLSTNIEDVHVVINKSKLEKALNRLVVFYKKKSITGMDKSQFIFSENSVKLASPKYHNFEIVEYDTATNAKEYSAILRFSDVINQLKAIATPTVDISYGNGKTIIFNSNLKQLIPEMGRA